MVSPGVGGRGGRALEENRQDQGGGVVVSTTRDLWLDHQRAGVPSFSFIPRGRDLSAGSAGKGGG